MYALVIIPLITQLNCHRKETSQVWFADMLQQVAHAIILELGGMNLITKGRGTDTTQMQATCTLS